MTRLIHNLRSLLLLLLLCPLTQVKAQSKHYIVESISINDGLSSDFIYCFAQDKYDLTWIGTASGLNCYDGKSVKRYVNNPNDPKSLSNDLVQALYYDEKRGELWIATDQGLNRYDYASDSFIRYLHTPETPNGQAYNDIIDILPYDDNHLWLASYRGGVHLFNKNTGDLVRNQVIYTQSSHSGYMKVYSLLYDSKGELWVGTMGNGLYRYDPNSDKLKTFATRNQQHLLPTSSVRSLWEDENERVWIGTDIGVFYYNTIANSFERCSVLSFLNNQLIYFIKEITARDDRRQFWIGTELGIYIIDIGSDGMPSQVSYHLKEGPEGKGLTFRSVRNVMQDGYQNVWIATYSGGVNLIGYEEPRFAVLQKSNAEQGGLSYNKILSLAQGSNGVLWVGTDGYGINRYDVKKDEITSVRFSKDPNDFNSNSIQYICCDAQDNLWVGTYGGGMIFYNTKTGYYRAYTTRNSGISDDDVRMIFETEDGKLMIATNSQGISIFDPKTQKFEVLNTQNSDIGDNSTPHIISDNFGNSWIGTYSEGLRYYVPSTGSFTTYKNQKNNPHSLPDNYICVLFMDSKNQFWVATKTGGLSLFDKKTGMFDTFTASQGCPLDITEIIEDKEGYLWLCSPTEIVRFDARAKSFEKLDGVKVGSFSRYSALLSQDGRIYIGATQGLLSFSPERILSKKNPPVKPLITDLQLFNQSVSIRGKENPDSPLEKNILLTDHLTLNYNQSVFSIIFVSPVYGGDVDVKYSYILEREDKDWNYVGNKNIATYRNLSPGKYTFKVRASNHAGEWSDDARVLYITILPPIWSSPYMYILYVVLLFLIIYLIIYFYSYRMRTHNRLKMVRLKRQKQEEIYQEKLQFFTNISHEFRTPLTLILSPLEKMYNTETDAEKRYLLQIIRRNAQRLLRLINQLLDFRKVDRGALSLQLERIDIVALVNDIYSSFEELSIQKNISYKFLPEWESRILWLDVEVIDKCVFNLLSNAFKFVANGGEIDIIVSQRPCPSLGVGEYLAIQVRDNGIGIPVKSQEKIFERFYQYENDFMSGQVGTGIGLHLVKSLVELHSGAITLESTEGQGSTFSLFFPIERSAYNAADFVLIDLPSTRTEAYRPRENVEAEQVATPSLPQIEHEFVLLLVEDDPDILNYLANELGHSYSILLAEDGEKALNILQEQQVDLIISDIMMPRVNGIELCKQLKNDPELSHVPIILLTAKSNNEYKLEGIEIGADDYITKPFDLHYLQVRIKMLLDQRKVLQKKYSKTFTIGAGSDKSDSMDDAFLKKAIEGVNVQMSNPDFNGEMLAAILGISRVHLHRRLKALTGLSTSEFIRNIRLNYAAAQLKQKNSSISEVCYNSGFSSPAYFSACFTKYFGISPKAFVLKERINE